MSTATPPSAGSFVLPPSIVTKVDLSHLLSELERIDNELTAMAVRAKTAQIEQKTPTLSQTLSEFMKINSLSLPTSQSMSDLIIEIRKLKDAVPVIHMTFAVSADQESLAQIVAWLRSAVHPQAVLSVGLQPGLIAGVYLRTPNHVHDLSLRGALAGARDVLHKEIGALRARC